MWLNDRWRSVQQVAEGAHLDRSHLYEAARQWQRFAGLLETLFPELQASGGIIESELHSANALQRAMACPADSGRWWIKADHALPVAGSIKARGGIYEVLVHAEEVAMRAGIMDPQADPRLLASREARRLFQACQIAVGSTGNLGLSIGIAAATLGFRAIVHMSRDAKEWKKARLRAAGVEVIEHTGDFGMAVAAGRTQTLQTPDAYFIDDENSRQLFLGYSVAAVRLARQLRENGIRVDAQHPLFVYLPCGVGGAPGGITFGLRQLFADNVHCFFAEPVAAPSMLIRLASGADRPVSVQEIGLSGRTEADGLAVGRASDFVAPLMIPLLSGIFTVPDDDLFEELYLLEKTQGLRIEPSAAAGLRGPLWLVDSQLGRHYLNVHGLEKAMHRATHILWTTGGALVPDEEFRLFHARGARIWDARRRLADVSPSCP